MRRAFAILPVLLALLVGTGVPRARAGDEPVDAGLAQEVERLLGRLASDDWNVREAARRRLALLARPARTVLEAHRKDADPEVRRTVESLLEGLGASDEPAAQTGALGGLGRVTFSAEGTLAEALSAFDARWTGRVRVPAAAGAAHVKVDLVDLPYFDALSALLAPAGLELPDGFDEAGQGVAALRRSGDPVAPPSASTGPFRVEVDSVSATRSLRGEPRPRYGLVVRAIWSPEVSVVSFQQPTVLRALDAGGKAFRSSESGSPTYFGVGGGRRTTSFNLTLDPPADGSLDRIATLDLEVRFRVRHGRQAAVFEDPAPERLPATRTVDGVEATPRATKVTLESLGPDPERSGWALGTITAVLPRGIAAESLGACLEMSDGTLKPMWDFSSRMTGSDGVVRMLLRAPGMPADGAVKSLRVTWTTQEEEIPVDFLLKDVPLR